MYPLRIRERRTIEASMVSGTMLIRLMAKRSLPVLIQNRHRSFSLNERDLVILLATEERPDSGTFLFDIENFKMSYVLADTRQVHIKSISTD